MIGARTSTLALSAMLLAGCASDFSRSYQRWHSYTDQAGPYQQWARCIDDSSARRLNPDGNGVVAHDARMFPDILADCRAHMTGSAWNDLSNRQMRQMLDDAYRAFFNVGADLMAQQEASII